MTPVHLVVTNLSGDFLWLTAVHFIVCCFVDNFHFLLITLFQISNVIYSVVMVDIWGVMYLDGFHPGDEDEELLPRTRTFRRRDDPFETYHEREFKRRYRMSKDSVTRLNDLIKHHLNTIIRIKINF